MQNTIDQDTYCQATLNYVVSLTDINAVMVDIFDARKQTDLSWRKQGFELVNHVSCIEDWHNDEQIKQHHYAEVEALATELSGCRHALVSGHISRNPTAAAQHQDFAPIQFVHSDFTQTYGDTIRTRYLDLDEHSAQTMARNGVSEQDIRSASRILVLQFWRNIGPQVMDLPLAFCDAQTVPESDLMPFHVSEYGGEAIPFDTFGVSAPLAKGAHRWNVFPALDADEVVAFRTYDSALADAGLTFWTPHSAFVDPHAPKTNSRHSVEVRATCLFYD